MLTRAPSSGGKTRLFTSLGIPSDPALLTALLLDTLDGAAAPGVRRVVAVTPPDACDDLRRSIGGVEVVPHYRWTGGPWTGAMTLHDTQKNLLVFGVTDPARLAALPA